jgi:hypothetical protein
MLVVCFARLAAPEQQITRCDIEMGDVEVDIPYCAEIPVDWLPSIQEFNETKTSSHNDASCYGLQLSTLLEKSLSLNCTVTPIEWYLNREK